MIAAKKSQAKIEVRSLQEIHDGKKNFAVK